MARKKKTEVMDGFSVVRMVSQAKRDGIVPGGVKKEPPDAKPAATSASSPPTPAANRHFKTTAPPKWTIRCFSCGYEFQIAGKTATIYCAKCRTAIDLSDHTIDGPWSREIKSGGRIHIKKKGQLQHVSLMAGNIIMDGAMDDQSFLETTQWLEIGPDAHISDRQFSAHNLRIAKGGFLKLSRKLRINHLEVYGEIEGDIEAEGLVTIRDGGDLRGSVKGAHLQVEEGGGLSARVFIWPQGDSVPK